MSAVGQSNPFSDASEFNSLDFLISRSIEKMQTVSIVQVVAANTGAQTVDVQVLVNLITGSNTPVVHQTIAGRPYYRMQGGGNAIICDPVAGDIGIMVFASRDTTGVIAAKGAANPSSARKFSWSDGMYFGGILNSTPTQYVQFAAAGGGITLHSPGTLTLDGPTTHVTGNLLVDGNSTVSGDATVTGTTTLVGATTAAAITSTGVITAAGFSGPGGTSPAGPPGPPGPTGPTGPTGPAYLDITDGTHSGTGITNLVISGGTVSIVGTTATITITGGGGGSGTVTSVGISTPGAGVVVGGGPVTTSGTLTVDLSTTAYAALALALTALQPKTGLAGSYTNANLTISSLGQITAVSNGSGGGGGLPPSLAIPNLQVWIDFSQNTLSGQYITVAQNYNPALPAMSYFFTGGNSFPTISATQLNGKNYISAPTNPWYSVPNGAGPVLKKGTIFAVFNCANPSAANQLVTGNSYALSFYVSGGALGLSSAYIAAIGGGSTTPIAANTWYQTNATYDDSTGNWAYRIAQAAAGSGTNLYTLQAPSSSILANNGSGYQQYFDGLVAEIIMFDRVLSSGEITAIETYLNTKWGV